ncbi:MAG: hypothetical protein Q8T13_02745 [Acidobacteriota bacterium]|nr:hypothetical protein [Acidobacteriota bacterium]
MPPPQILKLATAVVVASVLGTPFAAGPAAIDFVDALTGPDSPAFRIPFDKYALSPAGLVRTLAGSGTQNGIDRPVVRSASGKYLSRDFVFEVDVTIPASHGDIAWVGFGHGINSQLFDNEPTSAFLFRIHNLPEIAFHGIDIAVSVPSGGTEFHGAFRSLDRIAAYTPGHPMRFRIEHRGGVVTMRIPDLNLSRSFMFAEFADLFDSSNAYLFLSNSSEGTTFRNASLRTP